MGVLLISCTTQASDNQRELAFEPHNNLTANWNASSISICKLVKTETVSIQMEQKDHGAIERVTLDHHGLSPKSGWMCHVCPDPSESAALLRWHGSWLSDASGWSFYCVEARPESSHSFFMSGKQCSKI